MKKELNTYDPIIGLTEYDDWSYCTDNQMWYKDSIEHLPQPQKKSEAINDFICNIKVNHDGVWGDSWNDLKEEKQGLEKFAKYAFGEDESSDCTFSGVLFESSKQSLVIIFNDYGFISLDEFIIKLRNNNFATQYFEDAYFCKFIAWTDESNNTRFIVYSYREDYRYLEILFDITISRDVLIFKLGNILNTWKQTIQSAVMQYAMASNKSMSDLHPSEIINYCFPEIKTPVNNVIEPQLKYFEREYGNRPRKPDIRRCSNYATIILMILVLLVLIFTILGY